MNHKKIAFVHYPQRPNIARLDTMPFSLNSVINLGKTGWHVDLFLWEDLISIYEDLLPETVRIQLFKDPDIYPGRKINRLRAFWLSLQFLQYRNYICTFGVGQIGAFLGNILAESSNCPFIYFNDEFPSQWGKDNPWALLEAKAVQNAKIIAIPDPQRFKPLCDELEIASKPYAVLPNICLPEFSLENINWHDRLKIPPDRILFLNAGTLGEWAQVPELLYSVSFWPDNAVLILQSISSKEAVKYRKELAHLDIPGKIFWNFEPLSEGLLNSLVSYCTGNFALYRNQGPNIEYTGYSSGKLMRSIACSCPVIASTGFGFSFVDTHQLGVLVSHPTEIPAAVQKIISNREVYRSNCIDFCKTEVSFQQSWQEFCELFKQVTKIDLSICPSRGF
jgi:glycosyltransferase involved in cell wall biosynthesis